jgi:hypothetical protein
LTEYDKLVEEVRTKAEAFRSSTAKEYIPKMYRALRNESPTLTPEDARDRIEKDCVDVWSKRTILDVLPDEAKDLEKQKAGRLRQKEANSAAVSAAPEKKKEEEVMIDTEGIQIEDNVSPSTRTLMSAISSPFPSSNSDGQLQNNNNDDLLDFELSLPLKDVWRYMVARPEERQSKDDFWVNGTLEKRTGKVISATIGRTSQLE